MENNFGFYTQQATFGEKLKSFFKSPSWLNRLITINVCVYLAFLLLRIVLYLCGFLFQFSSAEVLQTLTQFLSCPADFHKLLLQPWGILTSLFVHANFWHLFFNMLMLYVIGQIFLEYLNEKHLLITYFLGGIFGNLIYMLAYNIFPVFASDLPYSYALGASGSIMAVMSVITFYRPNHEITLFLFGKLRLLYLTLIFVVIDLLSIPSGNAGGHIAHLGGILFGILYVAIIRGFINTKKMKSSFNNSQKKSKYYVSKESGRPLSDEEYNARKYQEKLKIDAILDKISQYGYDALSKEEKDFLFNYSKK